MIDLLRKNDRLRETIFLGFMASFCFSFSIFRFLYSDTNVFLFLNWNLFLAILPWIFTSWVILSPKIQRKRWTGFFLLFSWLLFFPNAPYILTDLFHLRLKTSMPIWFDLILILSFAWTGLLFGFLSLMDIERIFEAKWNMKWVKSMTVLLLFISSFGIYLGRYLRWNSWDILADPTGLVSDIGDRFFNPADHPRTWGMTLFMGLFLNMIYWSFRFIIKREDKLRMD